MGKSPVFSKPLQGETLVLYLAVFEATVRAVLIILEGNIELLVFYINLALLDP